MTNLIWCGAAIVLNLIIFISIRIVHKKHLDDNVLTWTNDEWGEAKTDFDKFWGMAKLVNIIVWVIIIATIFLFNSYNGYQEQADVGVTALKEEVKEIEPASELQVEEVNQTTLKEKEVKREQEIQIERKKSRDEFNDFLNNSN